MLDAKYRHYDFHIKVCMCFSTLSSETADVVLPEMNTYGYEENLFSINP